ncbi:Ax21 family protein [Pseudoxanthomonas koreensis]|uniref:OmpO family porin n=1 Tax=Pseudoxanthomonas koreensis TaxID=266061 RepID=UPI0035A59487
MKNKNILALALLAALPFAASAADGMSYNYIQGGYAATNTDGNDADGWGADGSVAIAPNFHLFGGYTSQEIDHTSIDFDQYRLGVGYNREIAPRADLVTRVAYEKFDAGSGFDYDGWSAEVGVRGALASNFEGYVMAGYEDGDAYDGEFYGRLGAQVKFSPSWGVSGDVKFVDGDTQWLVGPRYTW